MDTRQKIVCPEEALLLAAILSSQGRAITVVTGIFDVLLAAHAQALEEVRQNTGSAVLMVVLLPCADCLLAESARAELVASVSVVDYVIIAREPCPDDLIRLLGAETVISREGLDEAERRRLIDHVQRRHSG